MFLKFQFIPSQTNSLQPIGMTNLIRHILRFLNQSTNTKLLINRLGNKIIHLALINLFKDFDSEIRLNPVNTNDLIL